MDTRQRRLKTLSRLYDALIVACAGVAGAMIAATRFLMLYGVALRHLLTSPTAWIVPVSEYSLL